MPSGMRPVNERREPAEHGDRDERVLQRAGENQRRKREDEPEQRHEPWLLAPAGRSISMSIGYEPCRPSKPGNGPPTIVTKANTCDV